MKIAKAVDHIGTSLVLKRISSAYVIDYRNLTDDEIRAALKKTSPQYYYASNVKSALNELLYRADRQHRILVRLILKEILLNKDSYLADEKETSDDIIAYEQSIIDRSNEDILKNGVARSEQLELFKFVLETAWENQAQVSNDEFNLIEKLRVRLKITEREYRTIEAGLNRFPSLGNVLHTRTEIEETRRLLQSKGLLFSIRNEDGTDFDLIPDEIARVLREVLHVTIKTHGYHELLNYKAVRSKPYLFDAIRKCDISADKTTTLAELQQIVQEQVPPSTLLGGISPRDGLEVEVLKKWCAELGQIVSGTKAELIDRLIGFYDNLLQRTETAGDDRQVWYDHFEQLAARDLQFLRGQQLIEKDLECEARFEDATDFLFENRLHHKPLKLIGSAHADGILSFRDKVIIWDNKSKESPVHLKDHIKQFENYIKTSERPVAGFWVIGPDFTIESQMLAMQFTVDCGATVTLIKAGDLKQIAENWHKRNAGKSDDPFPLGYLLQPGLLNPVLVAAS